MTIARPSECTGYRNLSDLVLLPASAFAGLQRLYSIADFVAEELVGSEVRGKLESLARCRVLPAWVDIADERTFFELEMQSDMCRDLDAIDGAICKVQGYL